MSNAIVAEAPVEAPKPEQFPPVEGKLYVKDTTANDKFPERTHRVRDENGNSIPVTFHKDTYILLDDPIARRLLVDPAFVVCDFPVEDGGTRIEAIPKGRGADDRIVLKENETVARFDELRHDALLNRAVMLPGGSGFTKNTPKQQLIDFLLDIRKAELREAAEAASVEPDTAAGHGGPDLDGSMDQDQLKKMFGEDE